MSGALTKRTIKKKMSQEQAFDLYLSGENVFLTGAGGTGKSKLIRDIYAHATSMGRNIQVCATTGCAAILLGCNAKTIHSWAGIGLGGTGALDKVMGNRYVRKRWSELEILVLDEVSMLSDTVFNLLDDLGKKTRRSGRPFGGLQLIFSGDFFQLPPVDSEFCFCSPNWTKTFPKSVVLQKMFRQTDDEYCRILNEIRNGQLTKASYTTLKACVRTSEGITRLVPTRAKADAINAKAYETLTTEEAEFKMDCQASSKQEAQYELKFLKTNVRVDEIVKLKIGCQVMCVVNLSDDICNGSQGIVTRFSGGYPVVRFKHGETVMRPHVWESESVLGVNVSQVPLIYSWAVTIHKAQGATLDAAEIDAGGDIFECGQTYVALSRVRSLDGLFLSSLDVSKIRLNRKVLEFYAAL